MVKHAVTDQRTGQDRTEDKAKGRGEEENPFVCRYGSVVGRIHEGASVEVPELWGCEWAAHSLSRRVPN